MHDLRVQSLAGYGLEVPDIDTARHFYTAFGLHAEEQKGALALACINRKVPSVLILQGPKGSSKRLHHISFFIKRDDAPRFHEYLSEMGLSLSRPPFAAIRDGLWFQDPWGTWLNLTYSEESNPEPDPMQLDQSDRVDRHLWRELPRVAQPRKLGHMLLFTNEFEKTEMWFCKALGLRVSDRAVGKVSFLSAGTGIRDHHCFGLVNSTHRGFQHSSFHVDSFDQIGFGAWQMREAGFSDQFGLGRHALASNLFLYVRDPWGSWVEYYSDMDKISEAWTARDWKELPYIWGPKWSPEFWTNEMNANLEAR
jgi:catechol-2,3-dioxygenase